MDTYILNTTDYDYRILQHEGFGGICKYIVTPIKGDKPKLLIKHENIQSAFNAFMVSRHAGLCGVYTPRAYLYEQEQRNQAIVPGTSFYRRYQVVRGFFAG